MDGWSKERNEELFGQTTDIVHIMRFSPISFSSYWHSQSRVPMKRLLDADEGGPNNRNSVDVDITRILPEHVDQIAAESLEVLVTMARLQFPWLERLQANGGRLIVEHKDWHPLMRTLVAERFEEAREVKGEPALELPLSQPEKEAAWIPWPLLVQHYVDWNAYLQAMYQAGPPSDFRLFHWHLLKVVGTQRGKAFIRSLVHDVNVVFKEALLHFSKGPVEDLLALLEIALRRFWGEGKRTQEVELLLPLFFDNDMESVFFLYLEERYVGAGSDVVKSLRRWLPDFFLRSHVRSDVLYRIYSFDEGIKYDMADFLNLPNPVRYAVTKAPSSLTAAMCALLGKVGKAKLVDALEYGEEGLLLEVTSYYVHYPASLGLFTGSWTRYWEELRPVLEELVERHHHETLYL
jgi:hypothetical protein